jgi:hypothetical protein
MIQKNYSTDKGLKDRGRGNVRDIRAVLCPDSTGQIKQERTKICSRLWTHLVKKLVTVLLMTVTIMPDF